MDNKKLKGIVDIFNDSGLTFMEINEKEGENAFSIKLEKKGEILPVPASAHAAPQFSAAEPAASDTEREIKDFNKYRDVKSPMVGIFYTSPSPDSEPFIKVGDKVKKGRYALYHRGDETDERRRRGRGRRTCGDLRGKRLFGRIRAGAFQDILKG